MRVIPYTIYENFLAAVYSTRGDIAKWLDVVERKKLVMFAPLFNSWLFIVQFHA